eukprot:CAMPEP_0117807342 /NCGR_PEP_ID=MMETSP0948-20121206/19241_1 /TAXON_ID=44440 /ORGANISM="Chattonella subsalsa, Strain CCMP2191" /LENGTH=76 /DNA_ID=CAMNT_0005642259 /DNA_START=425 /DNA_END=653 /DNA_ORIENTATION=-
MVHPNIDLLEKVESLIGNFQKDDRKKAATLAKKAQLELQKAEAALAKQQKIALVAPAIEFLIKLKYLPATTTKATK